MLDFIQNKKMCKLQRYTVLPLQMANIWKLTKTFFNGHREKVDLVLYSWGYKSISPLWRKGRCPKIQHFLPEIIFKFPFTLKWKKTRFVKAYAPQHCLDTPQVKEGNYHTKRKEVVYKKIWDIGITAYIIKWKGVKYSVCYHFDFKKSIYMEESERTH